MRSLNTPHRTCSYHYPRCLHSNLCSWSLESVKVEEQVLPLRKTYSISLRVIWFKRFHWVLDRSRAFAKEGYSIALIARGADSLKSLEDELRASGVEATAFPVTSYEHVSLRSAFQAIRNRYPAQQYSLRAALYNASHWVRKPFLEITPEDIQAITETSINGGFAFAKEVISEYKNNEIDNTDGLGKRGVLIFTGATASVRGNTTTSAFAAGKFALRALSQSLAKEFGKDNIHVSHAIVDGAIVTPQGREQFNNPPIYDSQDQSLTPEGISAAYVYLAKQPRSAWTWELDLRPAHEKW